jgi:phytoene desaturase
VKKVCIVGAGIGGLTSAVRLAKEGFEVHVFEQKHEAGGKISEINGAGFRFDAGPSLFTMPHYISNLLSPDISFQFKKLNTLCHYFFTDGTFFPCPAEPEIFVKQASKIFNEDEKKLSDHFNYSKYLYTITAPVFLEKSLHRRSTYTSATGLRGILNLPFIGIHRTMHKANSKRFKNPNLVQLFNRYATYNGSNPWKAPSTLNVIPYLEMGLGAYFPKGGMISIARTLQRQAELLGVKFHFNHHITSIDHHHNQVTGVVANGISHTADMVVSNLDVRLTYKLLNQTLPTKIKKSEPSSSALIFYWGIKGTFPSLDLHNIFFSKDYKEEFESIFERGTLCKDPTIYINISSKEEPTDAPQGCENWFVMINAPANTGQDWNAYRLKAKELIVKKLSEMLKRDVGALIVYEEFLDPVRIENNTGSTFGSLYGSSSNNLMSAFFRQANFSATTKNLYFCGGSVHPGGGIPLCVLGGNIVSDIIIKKHHAKR